MFCKYCGSSIPDNSAFCPECGKKFEVKNLKKEIENDKLKEKEENENQPIGIIFLLILFFICMNTVRFIYQILVLGYSTSVFLMLCHVLVIVGIVILLGFAGKDYLRTAEYKISDLLVLLCIYGLVPSVFIRTTMNIISKFTGDWVGIDIVSMEDLILNSPFWVIIGLAALGISRRGTHTKEKKHKLIFIVLLAVMSVFSFVFAYPMAHTMHVDDGHIELVVSFARKYALFSWIWPVVVVTVFSKLGKGTISPVCAAVTFISMQIVKFILTPIFIGTLDFGVTGYALVAGIYPVFGLIILSLFSKFEKGRRKAKEV